MFIQPILTRRGSSAPFSAFASSAAARLAAVALLVGLMAGCGGGSSPATSTTVAQVLISPSTISLVAGQVIPVSASAVNASNNAVATTFTFNSSNTAVATISPAGLVCGGVWDSTFVVCNGNDTQGNPITGTATVTATAQTVTSGPVSVAVHPSITAVTVDTLPAGSCLSVGQTHQFTPKALHNGQDITSSVGNFSWATSDATVVAVDTNGLATARTPGLAGVVATIGATSSPAVSFKTCMPAEIVLHLAGDIGTPTESAVMNITDTKLLLADMIDENGAFITPAPITLFSTNSTVATNAGGTITAQSPGGAGFQAACVPPTCGNGLNTPIYSNVFSVDVSGTSPITTTVWAASSFPPPTNAAIPIVPIDISQTPPAVGSAIPLPGTPNSIVFDRAGDRAYIGTAVGLATLDPVAKTVTLSDSVPVGKVLAVSPDGTLAVISNAANDPSTGNPIEPNAANQRVWIFNHANNTRTTFIAPGAIAATFGDDGFKAYIAANNGNVYVFSPLLTFVTKNIPGSNIDATSLASGPFVFVANSSGIQAFSTCNNATAPSPGTNSTTIQLLGYVKNTPQIVAVEPTGIDVNNVSVATSIATPPGISATNCAPAVSYSNQFTNFGVGAFTARQLFVASNGSHIAVLPAGINKVLTFLPGQGASSAPLASGGTEPLTGGMTPDGNTLWIGVAGSNTVDRINLLNNVDEVQIPMHFQKGDGSPAPPDLVALQPK
jgi:hypothetical protein